MLTVDPAAPHRPAFLLCVVSPGRFTAVVGQLLTRSISDGRQLPRLRYGFRFAHCSVDVGSADETKHPVRATRNFQQESTLVVDVDVRQVLADLCDHAWRNGLASDFEALQVRQFQKGIF